MTRHHRALTALATGSLMIAVAHPAAAQEVEATGTTDAAGSEDIIVTASRRPQTLQEVPISVGVVTGAAIEQQGQRLFTDLQSSVPNLQ
ncbi:MAG: TonB-dependent receptor, partial [Sphingopyxis sp.]